MKVIFSVTNDLTFDQRMERICSALSEAGHQVVLVGRRKIHSKPLADKNYKQHRLNMFTTKGKLFYIEYNIRLFFHLLFSKADVFCAIDLDSILPHFLVTRITGAKFGYDAHEYFTEMEEVVSRPGIKKIWQTIEKWCVPSIDLGYTISNSYKKLFEDDYKARFEVIRNVCRLENLPQNVKSKTPIILYQGSVNVGRGLEELVMAMENVEAKLIVCGEGDILEQLKELVKHNKLEEKVSFKGYVEPEALREITPTATIGITLFTDDGLSNKYSLANRFFDYFHAGVPQLAMRYPEYISFNEDFEVALLIDKVEQDVIAQSLNKMLIDKVKYKQMSANCLQAREVHNWQNESKKLVSIYEPK